MDFYFCFRCAAKCSISLFCKRIVMKKVILMVMLSFGTLFADGFFVGADLSRSKVSSDIQVSALGQSASVSTDTYSNAVTAKAGYKSVDIKLYGYLSNEEYSEDVVMYNEGKLIVFGGGIDILFDNMFVGATLGSGTKDFDYVDISFRELGLRYGVVNNISENMSIEAGVQYKYRSYDSYTEVPVTIGLDEKVIGLFIGLDFNL